MILYFLSLISVIIFHELGHIIAVIFCNVSEKRGFFDFRISISVKAISIHHKKFKKPLKNATIAFSGPIFPIIISALLNLYIESNYVSMLFLLSLFNILFLHPSLPDGKNVVNNFKKIKESKQ
ncbi:hypothetical protein GCM10008934_22600 [Virgibacillus salarius]